MLDMVRPAVPGSVTLRDLKMCKLTPYFFNTFFNLEKYLEQEQRDPFANVKVSQWGQHSGDVIVGEKQTPPSREQHYQDKFINVKTFCFCPCEEVGCIIMSNQVIVYK